MSSNCKLLLAAAILLLTQATGCGGRAGKIHDQSAETALPVEISEGLDSLPAPSELLPIHPPAHRASYQEDDLIYHGCDYTGYLPAARVSQSGPAAVFQPQWSEATGLDFDNLALCMYNFHADGYDRAPMVHYGWEQAPSDLGTVWIGLSHFEQDKWVWFQGNPAGEIVVPSFDPYFHTYYDLIVAVVIASDEACRLRYVRLGPTAPAAVINVNNQLGLSPFVAQFSAFGSTPGIGLWDEIAWDFTSDGSWDSNSSSDLSAKCTYTAAGSYTATVRITNTYGEQAMASADLAVREAWRHSWGAELAEHVRGVCVDGEQGVCAVGYVDDNPSDYLFLVRFGSDGNLLWARRWGGSESDRGMSVFAGGGGALYVTGVTHSYDAGDGDVLVQRWDTEGNLVWTRTWGGGGLDEGVSVATSSGDLYVLGNTTIDDAAGDVLLLRYGQDGSLVWARALGATGLDKGGDLRAFFNFSVQFTVLHVAGTTESLAPSHSGALYARAYADGSFGKAYVWADGTTTYGNAVEVTGLYGDKVYLAGITDHSEKGYEAMLLEVSLDADPLAEICGGIGTEWITGLNVVDDLLVLTGQSSSYSSDGNPDCLLISFDADGYRQKSEVWLRNNSQTEQVNASATYLDNGVVLAGLCLSNEQAGWQDVVVGPQYPLGSWQDVSSSISFLSPTGTESQPEEAAAPLAGGILDSGGGDFDLLLTIHSVDKVN